MFERKSKLSMLAFLFIAFFLCLGQSQVNASGNQLIFSTNNGEHILVRDAAGEYFVNGQQISENKKLVWNRSLENKYVGGSFTRRQTVQFIDGISNIKSVQFANFSSNYAKDVPHAFILKVGHVLFSNSEIQYRQSGMEVGEWDINFDDVFGNYTPRYTDYDGGNVYPLDGDSYLIINADTGKVVDFVSYLNPYYTNGAEKSYIKDVQEGTTTIVTIPTDAPQLKPAVVEENKATISWASVPYAMKYEIEFNNNVLLSYSNSIQLDSLSPDTEYSIRIRALNDLGAGPWSNNFDFTTKLPIPVITHSMSASTLQLNWVPVVGAERYEVDIDGTVTQLGNATEFIINNLSSNNEYTYKVRAIGAANESLWSPDTKVMTNFIKPISIVVAPLSTSINLNWTAVTGASGYDIEVDGIVKSSVTSTSAKISGLNSNADYDIRIRAKNSSNTGEWSDIVNVKTLLSWTNVTLTATATEITLNWGAVDGATSYEVEADGVIISVGSGTTTYIHTGLVSGTSHVYKLRAVSNSNVGEWNAPQLIYTLPVKVGAVIGTPTSTTIALTWPAVTGAAKYEVERDGVVVLTPTTTAATLSALQSNQDYTIRVRSKNTGGDGEWSDPIVVKTQLMTPVVTNVSKENEITLNWVAITGATSYEVEADGIVSSVATGTSYTHTGLIAGTTHKYRVRAKTDVNESVWSAVVTSYTNPAKLGGLTGTPTNFTIALTWSAVTGATKYEVERDGVVVTTATALKATLSGLQSNQDYTIRVRSINIGGNGEWSDPLVVKTQLMTPVVTSGSSTESEITLNWAAISGATSYEVDADGIVVSVASGTSYTHTGLIAGTTHKYKVRAKTDVNESVWSTVVTSYTNPAKLGGLTGTPTNSTIALTWSAVTGATKYEVERDGVVVTTVTTAKATLSGLQSNQDYTIRVRSKNTGGDGDWSDLIVVKTLLVTPVVTSVSTEDEITLNWAAISGATSYEVDADGIVVSVSNGTSYTHTGLIAGTTHKYKVRAKTGVNESVWSVVVTSYTNPAKLGGLTGAPTNTTIALTWSAVTGATKYEVERDGVVVTTVTTAKATLSGLQSNQDYRIRIRSKNTSGDGEWSDPLVIKTLLSTPVMTYGSTENEITLNWAAITGATSYEVEADGVVVSVASGTSYTHTNLAGGTTHAYKVRAKNDVNLSVWSNALTAYTIPAKLGAVTGKPTTTTIVLVWSAVTGATKYEVERDGVVVSTVTTTTATLTGLQSNRDYTIRVRAKNTVGNGDWSDAIQVSTVLTIPKILTVSPNTAELPGDGVSVVVTGQDFVNGATVFFNGTAIPTTFVSNIKLQIKTPIWNMAESVTVKVVNPDGQSAELMNGFTYKLGAQPTITSVSPNNGALAGGETIYVNGTGYKTGAEINFGGTTVSATYMSATKLRVKVPAGTNPGVVDVYVINPDGQQSLSANYQYNEPPVIPAPTITKLSATNGSLGGGELIYIDGTGFQSGAQINFDGTTMSATYTNATRLRIKVPAGTNPGVVDIYVINPDGQQSSSVSYQYNEPPVIPAPTITKLSVTNGALAGGELIYIDGTGFQSGAQINFDGTTLSTTYVSTTRLKVKVPAAINPGVVDIYVINPDGQQSSSVSYQYNEPPAIPAPTITKLNITSGVVTGGELIIIDGTGYQTGAEIDFGGTIVTGEFISSTRLRLRAPAAADVGVVKVYVINPDGQKSFMVDYEYK